MVLNGFNLASSEKFDEALNQVNSLSECNISNAMSNLNNSGSLPSGYAEISDGIADIKNAINGLANGDGPEKLIDNYKTGYNEIKNAIINAYITEYELALENGNIDVSLGQLGELERNKFKTEFLDILKNMSEKNSNENIILQYASLTEFFKEMENTFIKISETMGDGIYALTNLQPKNNRDIAHRGYTPSGILDNSAEGFRLAGEKGFWGCEADVRFDANGNLVCSHGVVNSGENPTTFEEYLDICKEYGMTAIIDLKYENGPNKADDNLSMSILKTIEEKGMMDSCILQTNNAIDIAYIRENSDDARIWYLKDKITDDVIELIVENNVECVNIQTSENNYNRINKLTANGIDVCVWNVQTETLKNSLLNMGAKYVMADNVLGITPYQQGEPNLNDLKFNLEDIILPTLIGTDVEQNANSGATITSSINSIYEVHLTAPMGYIVGPEADETWYDLDMSNVVENMNELYGYTNLKASIRSDGVKLLSGTAPDGTTFENLVMVAADVRHEISNPEGTYERGQIVETTLGTGIVVDACGLARAKRENNEGVHFDIAAAWRTEPYSTQAYSEENYTSLKESVNNISNKNASVSSNLGISSSSSISGSSSSASKPSTSNGSSTSGSSSDISSSISNILPSNKFSNVLPELNSGRLGTMEIGSSSVNYEICNVSNSAYGDYVQSLLDEGYIMSNNGTFIKENYEVIVTITKDGNMNISCRYIYL